MHLNFSKTVRQSFAIGVALPALAFFLLAGCKEEKQAPVTKREVRRIKGEVEVLNSCSMKGAAVKMRCLQRLVIRQFRHAK